VNHYSNENVIILGASGSLAKHVIDELKKNKDLHLTLFLGDKKRLHSVNTGNCMIIEGDVLDYVTLKKAIAGQDIVYVNLAGDLEAMARSIVKAMNETGVKRIITISSIGIYKTPLRSVLQPYRKLADVIEDSDLDYNPLHLHL
jgi:putative NADH-flavin reductase